MEEAGVGAEPPQPCGFGGGSGSPSCPRGARVDSAAPSRCVTPLSPGVTTGVTSCALSFQADTQMQDPGRVSFKFINKTKLVSGSVLGKGGRGPGLAGARGGGPRVLSLPSPVPLCGRQPRGNPSCPPGWPSPSLGSLWHQRKAFCVALCLSFPAAEWDRWCCLCSSGNQAWFFWGVGGSVSMQNDSVCYVKAAFPLLGKILEQTEFKENSSNAKKMQMVRRMYSRIDENVDPCIREEDDEERKVQRPLPCVCVWGRSAGVGV